MNKDATSAATSAACAPLSLKYHPSPIMYVITRTGRRERFNPGRINDRIEKLADKDPKLGNVNFQDIIHFVEQGLKQDMHTCEIDTESARICASLGTSNYEYSMLASRIAIDNHHKNTDKSFYDKMKQAYYRRDDKGVIVPIIDSEFFAYVSTHQDALESMICYSNDFNLSFFGFQTFCAMFALKNKTLIERPQDMFMRVAVFVNRNTMRDIAQELANVRATYEALSQKRYTHATPTCSNAGTVCGQCASCFLLGVNDSIEDYMMKNYDKAIISKNGGGIGQYLHSIRSEGAFIRGTGGRSRGIIPMIMIDDKVMGAVHQKNRPGSTAMYLAPHHPDIDKFLEAKVSTEATQRVPTLFYGLWSSDIFMYRVITNGPMSLFDPDIVEDLSALYDDATCVGFYRGHADCLIENICSVCRAEPTQFIYKDYIHYMNNAPALGPRKSHQVCRRKAYTVRFLELEEAGAQTRVIAASDLFKILYKGNKEKGSPYVCHADTVNSMNMQKNLGVIRCSNLCTEIMEYSSSDEYATCNLVSVGLSVHVEDASEAANHDFPVKPKFNMEKLIETVRLCCTNLNHIIDKTVYPVKNAERSNLRHRPIGIGVQGLDDAYKKMQYAFCSAEARKLNKRIFETIYYTALSQSTLLSKEIYKRYVADIRAAGFVAHKYYARDYTENIVRFTDVDTLPKNIGSYASMTWTREISRGDYTETIRAPIAQGIFHWELYGLTLADLETRDALGWESLREHIKIYGVRNSLLVALMPTATTSQFLDNNECFEPFTSNLYKRKTTAGENIVFNKYLMRDLNTLGLWDENMKNYLIATEGSVQGNDAIPEYLRNRHKTAFEIDFRELILQSADRQPFVDQAQSLNFYINTLDEETFMKLLVMGWRKKLKTGKYYVHTRPAISAPKFTVDPDLQDKIAAGVEARNSTRAAAEKNDTRDDTPDEICIVCSS